MPPRLRYRSTQPQIVSCCPTSAGPTLPAPWLRAGHVSPGSNSCCCTCFACCCWGGPPAADDVGSSVAGSAARLLLALGKLMWLLRAGGGRAPPRRPTRPRSADPQFHRSPVAICAHLLARAGLAQAAAPTTSLSMCDSRSSLHGVSHLQIVSSMFTKKNAPNPEASSAGRGGREGHPTSASAASTFTTDFRS